MTTENRNLYIVDITKFLCSILIVCLHTSVFASISPVLSMGFRNTLATIAVPFFFTISGFFFYKKCFMLSTSTEGGFPDRLWSDKTVGAFRKTVKRLIFLYLIYSAVYFPFVVVGWIQNGFSIEEVLRYIYQFFITGSYSTIWYLLASIVAVSVSWFCCTKLGLNTALILSVIFYAVGVSISEFHNLVCKVPLLEIFVNMYYTVFGGVKNGIMFGFIYINIGAVLAKKYISGKFQCKCVWLKTGAFFLLVCVEAVLQYVLGFATHGVDLKFSLVPFTYYFVLLLLSIEGNSGFRGGDWQKHESVWKHLRDLSILIFLLQRIPLTLLESWKTNSIIYTVVILLCTIILAEFVILISKKFKKIKLY